MAKKLLMHVDYAGDVVSFRAGEKLYVRAGLCEGVTAFAKIEKKGRGNRLTFTRGTIAIVQDASENLHECFHLRLVREDRYARGLHQECRGWPRLRLALKQADQPRTHSWGGYGWVCYADEVCVADFSMSGAWAYIVPKADIAALLAALPPEPVIPGDMVIRFECRACSRVPKLGFSVERRGPHKKVWRIAPMPGSRCECGEDLTQHGYEVCTLNGSDWTGDSWVSDQVFRGRITKEEALEKWLNELPADPNAVDPWVAAIRAGYPINNFGYGGEIVRPRKGA